MDLLNQKAAGDPYYSKDLNIDCEVVNLEFYMIAHIVL